VKVLEFLMLLRDRDIQVCADGERLRCNAPIGALTPELRVELRQRKNEILEFLRSAEALAQQQRAIVPLQANGIATPVFAVAGHNGDVFCFRALARHLGEDQPFFGLQPPGLDGNRNPLTRVEDLAAYFAAQIREVQSVGPYVIAGYCAGGTIAFELARQLLREGAEVRVLALFGSPFPTSYRLLPQLRELARQAVGCLVRHTRELTKLPVAEWVTYIADRLRRRDALSAADRPAPPDPVIIQRAKVGRATLEAIRRYAPKPFSGRLVLFWPSTGWRCCGDSPRRWTSVAQCAEKYFGPEGCTGDTMLREPYAATFAQLLKKFALEAPARRDDFPIPAATEYSFLKGDQTKALSPCDGMR
jgi:thioesterase domain-containing protein